MALVTYPEEYPQCEGTNRSEDTSIAVDVSESGLIRGRTMFNYSTYTFTIVHTNLTRQQFESWDAWWLANLRNEVLFTWIQDGKTYRGIWVGPPAVEPQQNGYVNVSIALKARLYNA